MAAIRVCWWSLEKSHRQIRKGFVFFSSRGSQARGSAPSTTAAAAAAAAASASDNCIVSYARQLESQMHLKLPIEGLIYVSFIMWKLSRRRRELLEEFNSFVPFPATPDERKHLMH